MLYIDGGRFRPLQSAPLYIYGQSARQAIVQPNVGFPAKPEEKTSSVLLCFRVAVYGIGEAAARRCLLVPGITGCWDGASTKILESPHLMVTASLLHPQIPDVPMCNICTFRLWHTEGKDYILGRCFYSLRFHGVLCSSVKHWFVSLLGFVLFCDVGDIRQVIPALRRPFLRVIRPWKSIYNI